jgi:hypothetical protein
VPIRRPFVRVLCGIGVLGGGGLVVAGGLALRGPGMVAVGVAGALAACTAAGIARESAGPRRRSMLEAAAQAAAWTVGTLLVIAGIAAIAGRTPAVLAVAGGLVGGSALLVRRSRRVTAEPGRGRADAPGAARLVPPVSALTTAALGSEWLRTTAALERRLDPAARQWIVARREETLDELERRDPEGFARWLAAEPGPGSDPTPYVADGPAADSDAA